MYLLKNAKCTVFYLCISKLEWKRKLQTARGRGGKDEDEGR